MYYLVETVDKVHQWFAVFIRISVAEQCVVNYICNHDLRKLTIS